MSVGLKILLLGALLVGWVQAKSAKDLRTETAQQNSRLRFVKRLLIITAVVVGIAGVYSFAKKWKAGKSNTDCGATSDLHSASDRAGGTDLPSRPPSKFNPLPYLYHPEAVSGRWISGLKQTGHPGEYMATVVANDITADGVTSHIADVTFRVPEGTDVAAIFPGGATERWPVEKVFPHFEELEISVVAINNCQTQRKTIRPSSDGRFFGVSGTLGASKYPNMTAADFLQRCKAMGPDALAIYSPALLLKGFLIF